MFEKVEVMTVPLRDGNVTCPICQKAVPVQINVEVKAGSARITGTDGFRSSMAASMDTEIVGVRFEHSCDPREKDN